MVIDIQMTGNKPGVRTFVRKIIMNRPKEQWRPRRAKLDFIRLLGDYNFTYNLDYEFQPIRKNLTSEQIRNASKWCKESFGFKHFIFEKPSRFWFTSAKEKTMFVLAWTDIIE